MKNENVVKILIGSALMLSLLLAVYIIRHPANGPASQSKTGTILDQFSGVTAATDSGNAPSQKNTPRAVSAVQAVSPANGIQADTVLYYEKNTGRVIQANLANSQEAEISASQLSGFIKTIWAPNGQEVISVFNVKQGTAYRYFSFTSKRSAGLPGGVKAAVFSPDSTQIAYFISSENGGGIYVSQPDGTIAKEILPTRIQDMDLYWPEKDKIYMLAKNSDQSMNALFSLTLKGELRQVTDAQKDLQVVWSHGARYMLASFFDANGVLRLVYRDMSSGADFALPQGALASHCAFTLDGHSAICGVPINPLSDASLIVPEELRKINLTDGTSTLLYAPGSSHPLSASGVIITDLDGFAVFINSFDGRLYAIKI